MTRDIDSDAQRQRVVAGAPAPAEPPPYDDEEAAADDTRPPFGPVWRPSRSRRPPPHPSGDGPAVDWLTGLRAISNPRTAVARLRARIADLRASGPVSLLAGVVLIAVAALGPWLIAQFLGDSPGLMSVRRYLHLLPDQAPPGAGEFPTVWFIGYALLLFVPLYALHLDRSRWHPGRPGCLSLVVAFIVQLPVFAYLSVLVGLPALALIYTGVPGVPDERGSLPWTVLSPVVALAVAWWYRPPWRLGATRLLLRAGLLMLACATALALAQMGGLTLFGPGGAMRAIGVSAAAVLVRVCAWWIADRARPARLAVWAVLSFAAALGVGQWARVKHAAATVDLGSATRPALLATLVMAALIAFGVLVSYAVVQRVQRRLWRRLRPRRPGQVWEAYVPFQQDEDDGKYRPVLVLRTRGGGTYVMPITSKHKPHLDHIRIQLPLQRWRGTLSKESWLKLEVMELPATYFHHYRGQCRREVWEQVGPLVDRLPDSVPAATGAEPPDRHRTRRHHHPA